MSITDAQIGSWVHRLTPSGRPLTKPHYCESVVVGAAVVTCGKTLGDSDEGEMWAAGDIEGRCKTCSKRRSRPAETDLSRITWRPEDDASTHPDDTP